MPGDRKLYNTFHFAKLIDGENFHNKTYFHLLQCESITGKREMILQDHMKTKIKTLFMVLVLTLAFSNFSYALEDNSSAEIDNLSQSTLNSSSTYNYSNWYNSNNSNDTNSSHNISNSNKNTFTSSGSSGSNYIFQQSQNPGYYSLDLSSLPPLYDLRTLGRVTPPKNQIPLGTCWIFSAVSSLESCLLPGENWDFSENHMKNTLSSAYPWGYNCDPGSGGYNEMALAYFARWSGPVNESDDPYNTTSGISPENLTVVKHIQNCIFLPRRTNSLDNDLIKTAIVNYGGVVCGILWGNNHYNASSASYWYIKGPLDAGHIICLVGWDDNYDKSNFIITPPGNGAFIGKNSFGTDWGDQGYFYISYYDTKLGYGDGDYYPTNLVYMNAESPDNYKQIYQYDPFGMWGYISASSVGCSTAAFMNVFNATSNNPLQAASFYALTPNTTYQLYAIVNDTTTEVAHGVLEYAGYYTINFNQLIPLIAGQEFKIMVNITSPGCLEPIAIEYKEGWTNKATANPGESFIYYDGVWTDLTNSIFSDYPQANLCVKAFTAAASDLQLHVITSNLHPVIGETLKFIINVNNNGPDDACDVKVNELIPPGLDIISFQPSIGQYDPQTSIWTLGKLPVGKTATLIIYCTLKAAGELINEATITSSTYNLNPLNSAKTVISAYEPISAAKTPEVEALTTKTTGMQNTGTTAIPLILSAILLILGMFKGRRT